MSATVMNSRRPLLYLLLLPLLASAPFTAHAGEAFVDTGTRFVDMTDPANQAQSWAACAASYDIMSTILAESAPERARQLRDLGIGAQISIGMTLVMSDLDSESEREAVGALWAQSQSAMSEMPQTQLTAILKEGEAMGQERSEEFGRKLNATVVACINNLEGQRAYIDAWRDLTRRGLLESPGE